MIAEVTLLVSTVAMIAAIVAAVRRKCRAAHPGAIPT
jgi:hypothetical protein